MTYNMIFFGAGASYGSDSYNTPPLGSELFEELVIFNKDGWGKIPLEFSKYFHQDFEEGMKILSESHPHWMPPLQRAMAAYFFNFYPKLTNLYRKLAYRIKKSNWNGALSSINYERLLELSLIKEGLKSIVGKSGENINEIEICLHHGCCHLFCESVKGASNKISMAGFNITTRGPIKVISNPSEFNLRIKKDAFPPVMSYFEPQKITTSGVNFIEHQRARFSEIVADASIIVIVGVKVRPNDNHIWDPFAKTSAKLIYCSGRRSGQEFENWKNKMRTNNQDIPLNGYFDDCFDEICDNLNID